MPAGSIAETAVRFRNNRAIEAARRRLAITADILPLNDCTVQRLAVQDVSGRQGAATPAGYVPEYQQTAALCLVSWYCTEVHTEQTSVQKRNAKAAGQPRSRCQGQEGRLAARPPIFPSETPVLPSSLAKSDRGDDMTSPVGDNVDVGAVVPPKGLVLRADGHEVEHGIV